MVDREDAVFEQTLRSAVSRYFDAALDALGSPQDRALKIGRAIGTFERILEQQVFWHSQRFGHAPSSSEYQAQNAGWQRQLVEMRERLLSPDGLGDQTMTPGQEDIFNPGLDPNSAPPEFGWHNGYGQLPNTGGSSYDSSPRPYGMPQPPGFEPRHALRLNNPMPPSSVRTSEDDRRDPLERTTTDDFKFVAPPGSAPSRSCNQSAWAEYGMPGNSERRGESLGLSGHAPSFHPDMMEPYQPVMVDGGQGDAATPYLAGTPGTPVWNSPTEPLQLQMRGHSGDKRPPPPPPGASGYNQKEKWRADSPKGKSKTSTHPRSPKGGSKNTFTPPPPPPARAYL